MGGGDVAAYRCSMCALNYPLEEPYRTCLSCGEETDPIRNCEPMEDEDLAELRVSTRNANEQWVILYKDGPRDRVYATGYDADECSRQTRNCIAAHGRNTHVKAMVSTDCPPRA